MDRTNIPLWANEAALESDSETIKRLWIEFQKQEEEIDQLREENERLKAWAEDEDLDATDFAHPAWWRGCDHGVEMVALKVFALIDGVSAGTAFPSKSLSRLAKRLVADRERMLALEKRIAELEAKND